MPNYEHRLGASGTTPLAALPEVVLRLGQLISTTKAGPTLGDWEDTAFVVALNPVDRNLWALYNYDATWDIDEKPADEYKFPDVARLVEGSQLPSSPSSLSCLF
jgi:hypothetical protein